MGSDNALFSKPGRDKWRVRRRDDAVFDVVAPDGSIHGTYSTMGQAAATAGARQRAANLTAGKVTRACMSCCAPFPSEGIHSRLCGRCRGQNSDGWNPHGIAPRSGRPK